MSAICVFTPVVVQLAWPAMSALAVSALTSLGYAVSQEGRASAAADCASRQVELTVERSQGFEDTLGEEEELAFEREGLSLAFRRSADGRLRVCARGEGKSEGELRAAGSEALGRFLQAYACRKVAAELTRRGYSLEEESLPDGSIRLKAKRWS